MQRHEHEPSLSVQAEWVERLARACARQPLPAEDVAQETLLRAWQNPAREGGNWRGWLHALFANAARDEARREASRRRRELARSLDRPRVAEAADAESERKDQIGALLGHVHALAPAQRRVVELRYFEDCSVASIAKQTGTSPATVRSQLSRAHRELAQRLDGGQGGRERWLGALLPTAKPPLSAALTSSLPWVATGAVALVLGLLVGPELMRGSDEVEPLLVTTRPQIATPVLGEATGVDVPAATVQRSSAAGVAAEGITATVQFQLRDERGEALAGVPWIVFKERGGNEVFGLGKTDENGFAQVGGLPAPETILVRTGRTRSGLSPSFGAVWTQPQALSRLELTASAGATMTGRLVDQDGRPREGLTIEVPLVQHSRGLVVNWDPVTKSDHEGRFQVSGWTLFPAGVWVSDEGEARPERWRGAKWRVVDPDLSESAETMTFTPDEAEAIDVGDIVVPRAETCLGLLLDQQGGPVAGALISSRIQRKLGSQTRHPGAVPPGEEGFELQSGESWTDSQGRFSVHGHPKRLSQASWTIWLPDGRRETLRLGDYSEIRGERRVYRTSSVAVLELALVEREIPWKAVGHLEGPTLQWPRLERRTARARVTLGWKDGQLDRRSPPLRGDSHLRMTLQRSLSDLDYVSLRMPTSREVRVEGPWIADDLRRVSLTRQPSAEINLVHTAESWPSGTGLELVMYADAAHTEAIDEERWFGSPRESARLPARIWLPGSDPVWVTIQRRGQAEKKASLGPLLPGGTYDFDLSLLPPPTLIPKVEDAGPPPEASTPWGERKLLRLVVQDQESRQPIQGAWGRLMPEGLRISISDTGEVSYELRSVTPTAIQVEARGYVTRELKIAGGRGKLDLGVVYLEPLPRWPLRFVLPGGAPSYRDWRLIKWSSTLDAEGRTEVSFDPSERPTRSYSWLVRGREEAYWLELGLPSEVESHFDLPPVGTLNLSIGSRCIEPPALYPAEVPVAGQESGLWPQERAAPLGIQALRWRVGPGTYEVRSGLRSERVVIESGVTLELQWP